MDGLSQVIAFLKALPRDFYGQVSIRIRQNKAVLITEERTVKLDKSQEDDEE